MKTFLHLGGYKTGSTSVQHFFASNREQNLRDARLLFPVSGTKRNLGPGHALLAGSLRNATIGSRYKKWAPPVDSIAHELAQEVQRSDPAILLLSSETLLPSMDVVADRVDPTILKDYSLFNDARLIYYVRPQWEAALSKYKQVIRSPAWMFDGEFEEFVEVWLPTVLYDEILRPWADVFGRDRLTLRPYNRAVSNVLVDFMETLGLDLLYDRVVVDFRANVSNSLAATEHLKALRREAGSGRLTYNEQALALQRFEQDISDHEKHRFKIEFLYAHRDVFSAIKQRVASGNAKLIKEYRLDADFFG